MVNRKFSRSQSKFIRNEKARIRGGVLDLAKQKELINEVYKNYLPKKKNKPKTAEKSA
ncbi:MAG: hypothetical protein Q7T34_01720 [Candidatus Parcubacteria bacterium]|nr:hypothetical protein [Candidatus Parcubacteria bacterium]